MRPPLPPGVIATERRALNRPGEGHNGSGARLHVRLERREAAAVEVDKRLHQGRGVGRLRRRTRRRGGAHSRACSSGGRGWRRRGGGGGGGGGGAWRRRCSHQTRDQRIAPRESHDRRRRRRRRARRRRRQGRRQRARERRRPRERARRRAGLKQPGRATDAGRGTGGRGAGGRGAAPPALLAAPAAPPCRGRASAPPRCGGTRSRGIRGIRMRRAPRPVRGSGARHPPPERFRGARGRGLALRGLVEELVDAAAGRGEELLTLRVVREGHRKPVRVRSAAALRKLEAPPRVVVLEDLAEHSAPEVDRARVEVRDDDVRTLEQQVACPVGRQQLGRPLRAACGPDVLLEEGAHLRPMELRHRVGLKVSRHVAVRRPTELLQRAELGVFSAPVHWRIFEVRADREDLAGDRLVPRLEGLHKLGHRTVCLRQLLGDAVAGLLRRLEPHQKISEVDLEHGAKPPIRRKDEMRDGDGEVDLPQPRHRRVAGARDKHRRVAHPEEALRRELAHRRPRAANPVSAAESGAGKERVCLGAVTVEQVEDEAAHLRAGSEWRRRKQGVG